VSPEHRFASSDNGSGALVELSDVGRHYSVGSGGVVALADVSIRIAAEDFVVVLGPSGSGKTTVLNIIGALDVPSEGRVVVAAGTSRGLRARSCSRSGVSA
jgi:putative ABC transport system ATP-binding protein